MSDHSNDIGSYRGMKVTIMGLGLHGGGVAAARFFSDRGATVTVTDLRDEHTLKPSINALTGRRIRFVLGNHDRIDFENADLVIKNPAVPRDSEFLEYAEQIETDITIFLRSCPSPIIAVTGSKGKSTCAAAIAHVLKAHTRGAYLGGNITTSPLEFLEELQNSAQPLPVVLELSSWQLADAAGKELLHPLISVVTNILTDHQNRYTSMEEYIADKRAICEEQRESDFTILNYDDPIVRNFENATPAHPLFFAGTKPQTDFTGAWLDGDRGIADISGWEERILDSTLSIPGRHNRINMLAAGLALRAFGIGVEEIRNGLSSFSGLPHRLELVGDIFGIRYVNDSAATIPDATLRAVESFDDPIHLIVGGTDKKLDFSVLPTLKGRVASIHLLEGNAAGSIQSVFRDAGITWDGPYEDLESAVAGATEKAVSGDVVLLSPGCTSFEMFLNEFDRGDRFRGIVKKLRDEPT